MEFIDSLKDLALPVLENVPVLRAILGFLLVFFIPGFAWTLVFFRNNVNRLERIVLSFGLSIALVTLSVLGFNVVLNVRITGLNALLIIGLITVIPLGIRFTGRMLRKRKQARSAPAAAPDTESSEESAGDTEEGDVTDPSG
ncbi:MAG: DUF1616 domain-containing protein [Dehalococcoidales bacterium]|nr:DUF1616 domain-containing protein [Dehalococcoidales bacterium]